ncbi:MAG: V-type ATPase subunit [Candidatus Micrarchaeota archaeon]|nr:V-type ATPase subunit [Candidatus Micrarchaeota archaeon]
MEVENILDKFYYTKLAEIYRMISKKSSHPLKMFFYHQSNLLNIRNIIRLGKERVDRKIIQDMLVPSIDEKIIRIWRNVKNLDEFISRMKKTNYSSVVSDSDNVTMLDEAIEEFLLACTDRLSHMDILSISPIFGFILAKEIEMRNIRLLLHSKSLGLSDDFVNSHLIISGKKRFGA